MNNIGIISSDCLLSLDFRIKDIHLNQYGNHSKKSREEAIFRQAPTQMVKEGNKN
jgi:hypothetical protein